MAIIDYLLEGYELVSKGSKYIGQCNKIRCELDDGGKMGKQDARGEDWWKSVMGNMESTSPEEFVARVGIDELEDVLEYDDFDDYIADASREDPDFGIYKSVDSSGDPIYFIQHSGFEFFWRG